MAGANPHGKAKLMPEHSLSLIAGNARTSDSPQSMRDNSNHKLRKLLTMSVTEIELSESVANCLVKANILTLEQLAMTQEQDLMKHLKFESELRNEIVEKLHTLGLSLGMKFSDLLDQMDQEAEEAGKTPRSKAAFFQELAEQGHAPAQLWLGFRYREGDGVPQDYTKAVEWFRKAAEQGDATAQLFLGCCYRDGDGVPQDYLKAVEWFRKAAEQGDARAQFCLGFS